MLADVEQLAGSYSGYTIMDHWELVTFLYQIKYQQPQSWLGRLYSYFMSTSMMHSSFGLCEVPIQHVIVFVITVIIRKSTFARQANCCDLHPWWRSQRSGATVLDRSLPSSISCRPEAAATLCSARRLSGGQFRLQFRSALVHCRGPDGVECST